MPKTFHPKVLTANDLAEGTSVCLAPEGWSADISEALIATTPDQAVDLEDRGERSVDENTVIGPYLVDVSVDGGRPMPLTRRERIRADGQPSIPVTQTPFDQAA